MNIQVTLSGGNSRTLRRTEEVVEYVSANPKQLPELFGCLFVDDEIVRMRAGDALEKVCREHPDWFAPYIDEMFNKVSSIDQPSIQWHLAQMIGELKLTSKQHQRAVSILQHNLETATDWIVLNYSLEVFAKLVRKDSRLRDYFVQQLKKHKNSHHKSVAKRAVELLADLT